MAGADRADPAGEHHRLVVAAHDRRPGFCDLEAAEVAEHGRAAELVVVRRAAERPVDHDLERARDPRRRADPALGRRLPGLERTGQPEVRHREPDEAGLGLGAAAGRALVADLAARAGRRPRKRRDRRRMVMGLDLADDVRWLAVAAIDPVGIGEQPLGDDALDHRRVVAIGGQHALGRALGRPLDQLEQRRWLALAAERELGVEDLVAAMLAVGLREHHQLDVGRVAAERAVALDQVGDLVVGERQPEPGVGGPQRGSGITAERDDTQRPRRAAVRDDPGELGLVEDHALGHAIGERGAECERRQPGANRGVGDAALDPRDRRQPAHVRDVGRLRRPRRCRAQPRRDEELQGLDRAGWPARR